MEVLTLKTQQVIDFVNVQRGEVALGVVLRRPHDFATVIGEFLRCTEVGELIIVEKGIDLFSFVENKSIPFFSGLRMRFDPVFSFIGCLGKMKCPSISYRRTRGKSGFVFRQILGLCNRQFLIRRSRRLQ